MLTPEAHARKVTFSVAAKLYKHYQDHGFPGGINIPFDVIQSRMAFKYLELEQQGILSPKPPSEAEQREQANKRLEVINKMADKQDETRITLEGQEAIDFDGLYKSSKEQAKSKTPIITSTPGQVAKTSNLHK